MRCLSCSTGPPARLVYLASSRSLGQPSDIVTPALAPTTHPAVLASVGGLEHGLYS